MLRSKFAPASMVISLLRNHYNFSKENVFRGLYFSRQCIDIKFIAQQEVEYPDLQNHKQNLVHLRKNDKKIDIS
jgi:hypothetical protein